MSVNIAKSFCLRNRHTVNMKSFLRVDLMSGISLYAVTQKHTIIVDAKMMLNNDTAHGLLFFYQTTIYTVTVTNIKNINLTVSILYRYTLYVYR